MSKKIAICLRGRCLDNSLEVNAFGVSKKIDYRKCISSIFDKIINNNPEIEFDFYLHGWISNLNDLENILNDYKPVKYILEKQINFTKDYVNLKNYSEILQERYKHLRKKKHTYSYDNINYQNYFQNIFSYAYSISKVIELVDDKINYEKIIHMRYDIIIKDYIKLTELESAQIFTDNSGICHSPLFHGDFIYISNMTNCLFWKKFYLFLKTKIFNDITYINWVNNVINNKNRNCKGRYEHGIYSNQMIYAYFINKNNISYNTIIPKINCNKFE
jgi:hypothetical protein